MESVGALGLKRRFEEVDPGSTCSTPKDSDDEISSSDSAESCDSLNAHSTSSLTPTSILRRRGPPVGGKRVRFGSVTVFYFSRRQGFTSVPSQGGSSLGMARRHSSTHHYTLGEFAHEQERSHLQALRQHLHQEKLDTRKRKLTRNGTVACAAAETLTLADVSDEDLDVEGVEVDDCFFLQPVPIKRRRALLRASGIARIDAREKAELRAIRLSREDCGCDCRIYCDPRHCGCSLAGIKCQVDRMSFPCGCTRDGCGNAVGRVEFNPLRVRTHFLHTVMKLNLEKKRPLGGLAGEGFEEGAVLPDPKPEACPPAPLTDTDPANHIAQRDSLALENAEAVLHLQSAEERERRKEEEQGEEPALLQGVLPAGASMLCFAQNQAILKDPSSLLYYPLGQAELVALGLPRFLPASQEEDLGGGGGKHREEGELEGTDCHPGSGDAPATAEEDGHALPQQGSLWKPQESGPTAFEGEGSLLHSEA
ncbi:hypothetical protein SKAU_G00101110 [Synaphobranchus kaupii]|uniref:Cysteine/serine-rich nuclear protein N-terminal domain-containing protein n=1 Tax=Synaphobranchus kaupii TaxID=118154 RepID=A0A9Q1J7G3_SYNKA|nr:hypothetical protein SKAU_G00101110 [Synaphobranchus kaupii]